MKSTRQAMILQAIEENEIDTQEQLAEVLNRMGIKVTQATISRDIKELKIVKEMTNFGTYRYSITEKEPGNPFSDRLNTIFRECVTSFDYAQNIVVIHTLPGLANAAASALDAMKAEYILGTLAGDDTVVAILRDSNSAAVFCGEIKALIS